MESNLEKLINQIFDIFTHYTKNSEGDLINANCNCDLCQIAEKVVKEFNRANVKLFYEKNAAIKFEI